MTVRAHAKINLDLRVLRTRLDRYHELATVFQTLALHDTVTLFERDGPLTLTCDAPGVPTGEANLVWRAVGAMWRAAGRGGEPHGLAIDLQKRIPPQSGLGGGSADAAATLMAMNRRWDVHVTAADLEQMAATLGADVPFFLTGGTAEGRARGDRIRRLPELPRHAVLLVLPGFGVPTAEAFDWYDRDAEGAASEPGEWPAVSSGWTDALVTCRNDLEPPVVSRHPEVGALVEMLRQSGASLAAMTGSGSAVFGLFDRVERLVAAERRVAATAPGCRIVPTATIGREAYLASVLDEGD
jgi:4-diphosphocytidyl-2-C-methyl-D-erythritol kinase